MRIASIHWVTYHHQPVDSEFVEGLSETEVVEAEEDGAEEADDDHCEEPVLTVHIGGGRAHDAEEGENLVHFLKLFITIS